jgi:hypothetical protein
MKMSISDQKKLEKIYEDMTSGAVLGDSGFEMGMENDDFYAPDDARNPYGLGITTRKGRIGGKKRTKKKK